MSKEIKSTLELAMERAAKIPRPTAEEIRRRQELEYAPRGRALAERFLAGDLAEAQLDSELSAYRGEQGEIVRGAFLASMCQAIDLEDGDRTARALQGLGWAVGDDRLAEASSRLGELLREYQARRRRDFAEAERAESERLRGLGIAGSAVRPNAEQNRTWLDQRDRLTQEFLPGAEEIRRELEHLCARSESGSGSQEG